MGWIWDGIKLSELVFVVQKISSKVQKRNVIMDNPIRAVHQLIVWVEPADDTCIFSHASGHGNRMMEIESYHRCYSDESLCDRVDKIIIELVLPL